MVKKQEEEVVEVYVDRYNEKEIRNRRKFPGGHEVENGYDMNGSNVPKTTDPKTEEYNLF